MNIELDKIRIKAIDRYGANPFKFGGQRDGFREGYKQAIKDLEAVNATCSDCGGSNTDLPRHLRVCKDCNLLFNPRL